MMSIDHFGRVMKYLGMQMPMCKIEHMKPVKVWGSKDMIDFMYSIVFYYNADTRQIEYLVDKCRDYAKQVLFTLTVRFSPKSYVANGSIYIPLNIDTSAFLYRAISRKLGFIPTQPSYHYLANMCSFNTSPIDGTNSLVNQLQDPIQLLKTVIEFNRYANESGIYYIDYGSQRDQYNDLAERLVAVYDIKFSRFLPATNYIDEETEHYEPF